MRPLALADNRVVRTALTPVGQLHRETAQGVGECGALAGSADRRAPQIDRAGWSSPDLTENAGPCAPRHEDKRRSAVAPEEKCIVIAQPFFERAEAGAVGAGFHLGNEGRVVAAECVHINVVSAAAEMAGTR